MSDQAQHTDERRAPLTLQERIERSEVGRGVLSTFLVVTLAAIVVINLPASPLRHSLLRPAQPYLNALALDQAWALFAPDPRRAVIDLDAIVRYEDGSTADWHFPRDGALIGTYRDYRWRKWAENAIADQNGGALWKPAALWAAAREQRAGHRVVSVTLLRHVAPLTPPGTLPRALPWQTQSMYVLRFVGNPGAGG